ncbi:hypothetical protein ACUN24_19290 [Pedobacter sp. WC2501]|uniref:hypothetical protein n=1 Tax=Pedobacter sp. WC2501 TaxID=3461400 RepID=UPI0040455691
MGNHHPERWVETLTATTEQDDVFNEFVRGPLLSDSGGSLNLKITGFDESACREMMDNAISKSRARFRQKSAFLKLVKGLAAHLSGFFSGATIYRYTIVFEVDNFEVCYERLNLNKISFENDEALRMALRNEGLEMRKLIISRG